MNRFEIRGVVEGFYGDPWTMNDRVELMKFLGKKGYNLYIYAPKDDLIHRFKWRETYSKDFMENFKKITDAGEKAGVEVSMAISPGLSLVYSDKKEREILVNKFLSFAEIGVHVFCLFLDDIPWKLQHEPDIEKFSSLANAQSTFTNEVYNTLKEKVTDLKFILCPTEYCGTGKSEYLFELGETVNPAIEIMWTGPSVCSKVIPEKDAATIEETLKRPVLYWDNYPVNDATMVPELHIGSYIGRDPEISGHSSGLVLNPMNQMYASEIVLSAAADFLNCPESYDAQISWETAIKEFGGEVADELRHFSNFNTRSPINPSDPEFSAGIIAEFQRLYSIGEWQKAVEYLWSEGNKITTGAQRMREILNEKILIDLKPWLIEYEQWGMVIETSAGLLKANFAMRKERPSVEEINIIKSTIHELEDRLRKLVDQKTIVCGNAFRNFAMDILVKSKGFLTLKDRS